MKMERIVKTYYDGLEEGKILGRRCTQCGNIEFPPHIACNACGCFETEWVEISQDDAMMVDFVLASSVTSSPENKDLPPYGYADVQIAEGPHINAMVIGLNKKNEAEVRAKLPVAVRPTIYQRDGYKTVFFDLVEDEKKEE